MKVGYSGGRSGMSEPQLEELTRQLHRLGAVELHHGDCQGGDKQAHNIGRSLGLHIVGHPPKAAGLRAFCECDELRDPKPFLIRNRDIVLETQFLIATPSTMRPVLRSGTWSTTRFARRLPHMIILPSGEMKNHV